MNIIKRMGIEMKEIYNGIYKLPSNRKRIKLFYFFDMIGCVVKYGAIAEDYISLKFCDMPAKQRIQYITAGNKRKFITEMYTPESLNILKKKYLFNRKFSDYINRDWVHSLDCTKEQIINFVNKYQQVIVKPVDCSCGLGIHIVDVKSIDLEINDICSGDYVIEELLMNHPDLMCLNPTSLQTFRIETCIDSKGEFHLMNQLLMMGAPKSIVSNCHSGGCMAHFNIETGFVDSIGWNPNGWCTEIHPQSKIKLLGYKLPMIDELYDYIKTIAYVMPEARYVGWDITITENGKFELIEGNYLPGHCTQGVDGVPRLKQLESYR